MNRSNVLTPPERRSTARRNSEEIVERSPTSERRHTTPLTYSAPNWKSPFTTHAPQERRLILPLRVVRKPATFRLRDWGLYTLSLALAGLLIVSAKSAYLHWSTSTAYEINLPIAGSDSYPLYRWEKFHRVAP